jgi:hypothetical protein
MFGWLVADSWCWFVLREEYCWLVAGGWFVLREKNCWLVADKNGVARFAWFCIILSISQLNNLALQPVRSAYQPPANSTFLSEQTSQQQSASSTFLSEQTSTNH